MDTLISLGTTAAMGWSLYALFFGHGLNIHFGLIKPAENITIGMEADKLRATKRYMEKKDASIEQELGDALQKLYEKYVPAPVREYIDESVDAAPAPQAKQHPRLVALQRQARANGQGLWAQKRPLAPWDYRRQYLRP